MLEVKLTVTKTDSPHFPPGTGPSVTEVTTRSNSSSWVAVACVRNGSIVFNFVRKKIYTKKGKMKRTLQTS
jgi:hypothetical protein